MRLSDSIEQFIKTMLAEDEHHIELKRNELAEYFGCAPSQINYVLATRFTPDHGYFIESRRGGGGCIRIIRIEHDSTEQLMKALREQIGSSIDELTASHILQQLKERQVISASEAAVMTAATSSQAISVPIPAEMKDTLRAKILTRMLLEVARNAKESEAQ